MNCQKCKHEDKAHKSSIAYPTEPLCYDCFGGGNFNNFNNSYHEFQMDNLDLIEKLAKERNLI
jgi:hypothetical protein